MSVAVPVIDTIDGPNRLIHLRSGVTEFHPVDDIYAEVRTLRRLNQSLRGFDMFCRAIPIIEKSPGVFTGRGLILLLGTRIIPHPESELLHITGELLSDEGISGTDLIDISSLPSNVKLKIAYEPPPATEVVTSSGGSGGMTDADRDLLELTLAHARAANFQTKKNL